MRLNFFLSEAVESLRRNWVMTIASVLTVLVTMAILGVVLVTDKNLKEGTTSLTNRVEVEVFVKGAPPQQASIDALRAKIAAMPEVKNFTYVSQAQALQNLKNMLGKNADQIINNLQSNPLPASYKIFVKNPNDVDAVAARFFNDPNVDNDPGTTDGVSYAKQTVRNLLGTVNLIEKAMWVVTVLFALAAILLTSTTVRLSIFARRREVEIMQARGGDQLVHPLAVHPRRLHHRAPRLVRRRARGVGRQRGRLQLDPQLQARLSAAHQVPAGRAVGLVAARPHPHAGAGRRRAGRARQRAGPAPLPASLSRPRRPAAGARARCRRRAAGAGARYRRRATGARA